MPYSTSNPPSMIAAGIGGTGVQLWHLSGTDSAATVDTSGYITNGGALGMRVGDLVSYTLTSTGAVTQHRVVTVSSTYPGAVDLGDGTAIASATNTD